MFYDNNSALEYNMSRLQSLEISIAKLKSRHNFSEAKKKHPQEANGSHSCLYLAKGADIMLTSNLWDHAVLHNGARGTFLIFFYMNSDGP